MDLLIRSMKNITFKQIRAFAAVAQEHSFTRAAERLHLTQSTLTASIKLLESEIGLPLIDRSTRALALTPQGQLFLPTALQLIRDLRESLDDMSTIAAGQRGSVTVAATASFIHFVMAPALAQMAVSYPGIVIRLSEVTAAEAVRMVIASEADFGVSTLFESEPALESLRLLNDGFGVSTWAGHALQKKRGPVCWSDLVSHTMIGLHRSNGIRTLIDQHKEIPQQLKQPAYEVGAMSSMQPMLAQRFCFAAIPAMAAMPLLESGLAFKKLVKPQLRRELYMFKKSRRSLTPAARALVQAIAQSLAAIQSSRSRLDISIEATAEQLDEFCLV
jgi:DNA-binding transcriptional LysR family regulator